MIDEDHDSKYHRYQSYYNNQIKGRSPNDRIVDLLNLFYSQASGPFKKMQTAVLLEQN
jgi:hypothetical protein